MGAFTVLRSNYIVTLETIVDGYLLITPPKIKGIKKELTPDLSIDAFFDYRDHYILPGFIDMHIHGLAGYDVHSGYGSIMEMSCKLAEAGVTAFLPTTVSLPIEQLKEVLQEIKKAIQDQEKAEYFGKKRGAKILGARLEGPFLNEKKKGVMSRDSLLNPCIDLMEELEAAAQGIIKVVTLAPELPGGLELVTYLKERGYIVAGGHTDATYYEMIKGIESGICLANHLFNAMRGIHHREPGAAGTFLVDPRVTCELIADNLHVHPQVMGIVLKCKGLEGICLISDAVPTAGMGPGKYRFAGQEIFVDEKGQSSLQDGTIAGSTVLMPEGLKNLIGKLSLSPVGAAHLAAVNPARVLGIHGERGAIIENIEADFTIMDKNYEVKNTWVGGVPFHE